MAITGIPEVIHDFNMYLSGKKLLGITGEVSLPEFEAESAEVNGAGILGTYESPLVGRYGSMEQEIPFRVINESYFKMINPSAPLDLTLRGALQYTKTANGAVDYMGMRVIMRGKCKKIAPGTVKNGTMDSSITIELTYIKIEMDGKVRLELDKINPKFKVNGTDLLAKVRKFT